MTGSGCPRITRRSISTAPPGSGTRALSGSTIPASPSSPWTCPAERGGARSGRTAPAATGISGAPATSRTRSVFSTTRSSDALPVTQLTPMRSMPGCFTAARIARASSTPVSTSRITSTLRRQDSNLDLTAPKAVVLPLHQSGSRLRLRGAQCATARIGTVAADEVDRIVDDWSRERPDVDFAPLQVLSRVGRLAKHLDRARRRPSPPPVSNRGSSTSSPPCAARVRPTS